MRGGYIALDSEPANVFGGVVIDILDYKNTNKYKTVRILSGTEYNNSNGGVSFNSGLWQNTDAITTITLQPSGANFAEYSQFALYGIKGS
jgi:hypothetical protein